MKQFCKKASLFLLTLTMGVTTTVKTTITTKAATPKEYKFTIRDGAGEVDIAPDFDFYNGCWHFDKEDSSIYCEFSSSENVNSIDTEISGYMCNCTAVVHTYDKVGNLTSTTTISGYCILPGQSSLGNAGDILWTVK